MKLQTGERMNPKLLGPPLANWYIVERVTDFCRSTDRCLQGKAGRSTDRCLQGKAGNAGGYTQCSVYSTQQDSHPLAPRSFPGNRPNILQWEDLVPGFCRYWKKRSIFFFFFLLSWETIVWLTLDCDLWVDRWLEACCVLDQLGLDIA